MRHTDSMAAKRALLASRVLLKTEQENRDAIRPRAGAARFPLSSVQKQIWFAEQLHPESPVNNIFFCYRLYGKLNVPALETAFTEVMRRHEVLRARFVNSRGVPEQSIAPPAPVSLSMADLSRIPHEMREREALAIAGASFARPFDLSCGQLLRASLLRLAADEHILAVAAHHIAFDGWSLGLFCQDLAAAYRAAASGAAPVTLPPLPIQYADFAAWEEEWLEGSEADRQARFWSSKLAGAAEPLQLPIDRPRPVRQTFNGGEVVREIPCSTVVSLTKAARQENVTLYMALYAAFRLLLGRYTGQSDILISTPVAGRSQSSVEELIGCFINTVTLRTPVDESLSFSRWVGEVRTEILEALANHDLPFDYVIEKLRPERDASRPTLVQTYFALQNSVRSELYLPGIIATYIPLEAKTSRFDLSLDVFPVGGRLRCVFTWNTDLFLRETVERLAEHYLQLITGIAARPTTALAKIDMLAADERSQIVAKWNETALPVAREACVHDLFTAQAGKTPDAIAAEFSASRLTYRELDEQSSALARHLRGLGVAAESLVGICLDRSLEMLVAVLGVLKAGGAYVPLDPAFPDERLSWMLEDSGTRILISRPVHAARFPKYAGKVVTMEEGTAFAADGDPAVCAAVTPENLAYVLYTSGSTGRPKGIMVEHRSLVNFLESMRREPGMTRDDILLAVTTLSFDIAALELFLPLVSGAKVVIADRMAAADGRELSRLISQRRITVMQATPATWRLLLESGWTGSSRLRALCGGEALPRELAEALLPRTAVLWNMYGPTETTVWSLMTRVEPGTGPIPIGRPIANTTVYILDAQGRPVPPGVTGRLHIGGAGLARGYRNLPDKTAQAWFFNPLPERSGERIYHTGDLARYRSDGLVEFLGRADGQVKIRGYRIETAEIESVLRRHEAVRDAVVVVRGNAETDKQLVAWIIPVTNEVQPLAEIRKYAGIHLPGYMMPATIHLVDEYPLTQNGKVNRRALAESAGPVAPSAPDTVPPTLLESVLLRIFEELFEFTPIGVNDNFFDLGGHSLLAARLVARIEKETGHNIPVGTLFESPTVRDLARALAGVTYTTASPLVRLNREGDESQAPLFCIHWLNAKLVTFQKITFLLRQDRPIYGLQMQMGPDEAAGIRTIEDMAALYIREIRRQWPHGPYHLAGSCLGGVVAFEMARQLKAEGEEVGLLLMIDARMPGKLSDLHDRNSAVEYLDRYLGEFLLSPFGAVKRWIRETARRLSSSREKSTSSQTTKQIARISMEAAQAYRPRVYPGKVTLFLCSDAPFRSYEDRRLAWYEVAQGGLEIHIVPGDHATMEQEPNVQVLAADFQKCFDGARGESPLPLLPANRT
ncbi:MAG TPA: amino acid adenylation domain-containing protein [Bryobacteraceae bacterium]|nr:amino acid adenylation domain-containing protein [Bryobacteraceae bacterium]